MVIGEVGELSADDLFMEIEVGSVICVCDVIVKGVDGVWFKWMGICIG